MVELVNEKSDSEDSLVSTNADKKYVLYGNPNRNLKYCECDCTSPDHILRMSYFDLDPDFMYVEVSLVKLRWYKRLWQALKYVFGFKSRYGDFDEFVWNPRTAIEFKKFVEEFLRENDKWLQENEQKRQTPQKPTPPENRILNSSIT